MTRSEALETIMRSATERDVIVSTTGLTSRYLYEHHDGARQFYIPGSMGLVSSFALGIAVSRPNRRVIAIDGDGSLLMNLGTMATIGCQQPGNLMHIVLDNAAYGSCSEEPTVSGSARLDQVATAVGYRFVAVTATGEDLAGALVRAGGGGPAFVLVRIELGGRRDYARPLQLELIRRRLSDFLSHD